MQFKGFYWLSCYGIWGILQCSIRVCVIIRILNFIFSKFWLLASLVRCWFLAWLVVGCWVCWLSVPCLFVKLVCCCFLLWLSDGLLFRLLSGCWPGWLVGWFTAWLVAGLGCLLAWFVGIRSLFVHAIGGLLVPGWIHFWLLDWLDVVR